MPLVQVFHDLMIGEDYLKQLAKTLPESVAKQLSCDEAGGGLSPTDITVIFHPYGALDIRQKRMEVIVTANHYSSRENNLDERARSIACDIYETTTGAILGSLSPYDYFVWIVLGTGGFWSAK